jgi:hypothetical protein
MMATESASSVSKENIIAALGDYSTSFEEKFCTQLNETTKSKNNMPKRLKMKVQILSEKNYLIPYLSYTIFKLIKQFFSNPMQVRTRLATCKTRIWTGLCHHEYFS